MLAYKEAARVRLISRNAVDRTARFRQLPGAIAKLRPDTLVLYARLRRSTTSSCRASISGRV